jgi:hypothetical protein
VSICRDGSTDIDVQKRGQIICDLEAALALADEIEDGNTGFQIERALDEARSRQFTPVSSPPP